MKYTYENQKDALNYLVENFPHDFEKFQRLYEIDVEEDEKAVISLHDILFSDILTKEEKVAFIKLYGHDENRHKQHRNWTSKTDERDIGYSIGIEGLPLIDECIKEKNFSGVEALLSLGNHISVATIPRIIKYIDDPSERYRFCELIVKHYGKAENIDVYTGIGTSCYLKKVPTLCDLSFEYADLDIMGKPLWYTGSPMEYICATNDLELVKLFLPTVKNIKPLFQYAVKSGNVEMAKLFIEAGADVNFQDLDFTEEGHDIKPPLKIAIDNNDLEMVTLLSENGADLNLTDKEIEDNLFKYQKDSIEYITQMATSIEYAINVGPASIIDEDLLGVDILRYRDSYEKQFVDRMAIVKYLYEHGATFGEGKVNYTDLICFAIKCDDFTATEYFFAEASQNHADLDISKIINFIHIPGVTRKSKNLTTQYKTFEEGARPWFEMCHQYSKTMDSKNYHQNVKLMLNKMFNDIAIDKYQFEKHKDIIAKFSHLLSKEDLRDIPAIFKVEIDNLEEVLDLGYDIGSINENGDNILIEYMSRKMATIEDIHRLVSLGANPNYQNPNNGASMLSAALSRLPQWDFSKFVSNFNLESGDLYLNSEEYEKKSKEIVKTVLDLSSQEVIMSDCVKQTVSRQLMSDFSLIIYSDVLKSLAQRNFRLDNEQLERSVAFLNGMTASTYIKEPWKILSNLYNSFDNKIIGANEPFPRVEDMQNWELGTEENNKGFWLIYEHLNRNFRTSIEQIEDPDKVITQDFDRKSCKYYNVTELQVAQNNLLNEISRYIGVLDYRQVLSLLDAYPLVDEEAIVRNDILPRAMNIGDIDLCEALVNRGISIVCYDQEGCDITKEVYKPEQITLFSSLNKEYNANQGREALLAEIGCPIKTKVLSTKK